MKESNNPKSRDKLFWLAFSAFKIHPKKFLNLVDFFGSAKEAFLAKESHLSEIGLKKQEVERLVFFRKKFSPDSYYLRLCEKGIDCYFLDSISYPKNLKNIDDPPFVLYCRGKILKKDKKAIAFVGSRKATAYGRMTARSFSSQMAKLGFTIVSGLARGIDASSHQAALLVGGRTIAVLGSGLDYVYPPENKSLFEEICKKGAAVSEYPPQEPPLAVNFPQRNRIISGLSLGVVVVEAELRSGALITARLAGEQGREIFTIPGPVTSSTAKGVARLANSGAKLICKKEDILEELEA